MHFWLKISHYLFIVYLISFFVIKLIFSSWLKFFAILFSCMVVNNFIKLNLLVVSIKSEISRLRQRSQTAVLVLSKRTSRHLWWWTFKSFETQNLYQNNHDFVIIEFVFISLNFLIPGPGVNLIKLLGVYLGA